MELSPEPTGGGAGDDRLILGEGLWGEEREGDEEGGELHAPQDRGQPACAGQREPTAAPSNDPTARRMVSISDMSPHPDMHTLARQFAFDDQFIGVITAGFEPEHWTIRPGDAANSAHWILGHLAVSRRFLTRLAGAELPREDWEATFDMGADHEFLSEFMRQ